MKALDIIDGLIVQSETVSICKKVFHLTVKYYCKRRPEVLNTWSTMAAASSAAAGLPIDDQLVLCVGQGAVKYYVAIGANVGELSHNADGRASGDRPLPERQSLDLRLL